MSPRRPIGDASGPECVTRVQRRGDTFSSLFAQVMTHVTRESDMEPGDAMTDVTRYPGSTSIRGRVRATNQTTRHTRHHPSSGGQR